MPKRIDYRSATENRDKWQTPTSCAFDPTIKTMVHRFSNGERVCRCGKVDHRQNHTQLSNIAASKLGQV